MARKNRGVADHVVCLAVRILKEERNYILSMIKKIRASGANVLLIQKSILRDAVTDLSLHYLVRKAHCCFAADARLSFRRLQLGGHPASGTT